MNVFDPKDLNEDEIVMYETAAVQTVTPAKYVMDLLRRLHGLRAAVHSKALRDAEGAVLDWKQSKTEKDGSKAPSKASTVEAEKFEVGDNVRILRGVHKDRIGVVKMKDTSSFAYVCLEGNVLNYAFAWADLTKLPKFKINDRVVVRRTGVTGKVVHIGPRGLDVSFTTRGGGCCQESELEYAPRFKKGDRVTVTCGSEIGKSGVVESAKYGSGCVAVMVRGVLYPILGYRKPDTLHHLPVDWLALTPSVEPPKPKPVEVTAICREVTQAPGVWGLQANAVFDIVACATDSTPTISGRLTLHAPLDRYPYLLSALTKYTPFKLRLEEK